MTTIPASEERPPVRIAALVLAHSRPDRVERLLDRLGGPLWSRYVHLDAKTPARGWEGVRARAHFVEPRARVVWGGLGMVEATLRLMEAALQDRGVTHLYLMSGQCWPIKTDAEIEAVVSASGSGDFIEMVRMPTEQKPLTRLTQWHFNWVEQAVACRINRVANWFAPPRSAERLLRGMEPWAGAQWWMLSRASARRMLDFVGANPWFLEAFRFSLAPDEMVFQTLAHHLGARPARGSPTAAKWIGGRRSPEPLTAEDLEALAQDWRLFARKVK